MGFSAYSYLLLPVDFRLAWPKLRQHLRKAQPDAVILTGEKNGGHITLESVARNLRRSRRGPVAISERHPPEISSAMPAGKIAAHLAKRPRFAKNFFSLSKNAGDFLCNFVYFKMLSSQKNIPALFVHICALEKKEFTQQRQKYSAALRFIAKEVAKAIDGAGANYTSREN